MSRLPFVSTILTLLAATSIADARPSTVTMTCGQAAATVAKAGAIVLTTGEFTYERFVATGGFCLPGEITEPGIAPTTDSGNCQVGYVCRQQLPYERSAD
jgi:hypothetical protein